MRNADLYSIQEKEPYVLYVISGGVGGGGSSFLSRFFKPRLFDH